jgi:hypothetical protein
MIRHRRKLHRNGQGARSLGQIDFLGRRNPRSRYVAKSVQSDHSQSEPNDVLESGSNAPTPFPNISSNTGNPFGPTLGNILRPSYNVPPNNHDSKTALQQINTSDLTNFGFACPLWRYLGSPAGSKCNKPWIGEHRWFEHCKRTHKKFRHGWCLEDFKTEEALKNHVHKKGLRHCKKCRRCFDSEDLKEQHECDPLRRRLESSADMWQFCYEEDFPDGARHDPCKYCIITSAIQNPSNTI